MNQLKLQYPIYSAETVDSEAFAGVMESILKRAKLSMNQDELNRLVVQKTAAYDTALQDVDSAKALLSEIAADVSCEEKATLEAAVKSVDRLTMFQGDAAMLGNGSWKDFDETITSR